MEEDEIVSGGSEFPLYGRAGSLLYADEFQMSINIVISWSGGKDVDICGFYTHGGGEVGFGWTNGGTVELDDGFKATHGGDNTSGGPETIDLSYTGSHSLKGKSYEVHANWYSVGENDQGEEEGSGGPATITATDSNGHTMSSTIMPATEKHRKANRSDPGVIIRFKFDGSLKEIAAI